MSSSLVVLVVDAVSADPPGADQLHPADPHGPRTRHGPEVSRYVSVACSVGCRCWLAIYCIYFKAECRHPGVPPLCCHDDHAPAGSHDATAAVAGGSDRGKVHHNGIPYLMIGFFFFFVFFKLFKDMNKIEYNVLGWVAVKCLRLPIKEMKKTTTCTHLFF